MTVHSIQTFPSCPWAASSVPHATLEDVGCCVRGSSLLAAGAAEGFGTWAVCPEGDGSLWFWLPSSCSQGSLEGDYPPPVSQAWSPLCGLSLSSDRCRYELQPRFFAFSDKGMALGALNLAGDWRMCPALLPGAVSCPPALLSLLPVLLTHSAPPSLAPRKPSDKSWHFERPFSPPAYVSALIRGQTDAFIRRK